MADLTQQNWIERTRRLLLSGKQEERNVLASPYVAGSGVLVMSTSLSGIVPGVRLGIGRNVFYVRSMNPVGLTVSVIGGQEGSTDANASSGAVVWVAPRFTEFEIFEEIKADLGDLSAPDNGLWQMSTVDLTASASVYGYNLTGLTDLIDVYKVLVARTTNSAGLLWQEVPKVQYRIDENMDPAIFASTFSLQLHNVVTENGNTLRVLYRYPFTVTDDPTVLMSTTGLPTTAYDLPPMGAAMRLVAPKEIQRNSMQGQGDTRRQAEVPPGAVANSFRSLAAVRAQRIASEAARLVAKYPDRRI